MGLNATVRSQSCESVLVAIRGATCEATGLLIDSCVRRVPSAHANHTTVTIEEL